MKTVKDLMWSVSFMTGAKLKTLPESDREELVQMARSLGEQFAKDTTRGLSDYDLAKVLLNGIDSQTVLSPEAEKLLDALMAKKEEVFARCSSEEGTSNS